MNGVPEQPDATNIHSVAPALQPVFENYKDVFMEPKSLPPLRKHDHYIPLLEGTQPINQ